MKEKELAFKILFFTDPHHTMRIPSSRKDDSFITTLAKVDEIIDISIEEKVDEVLVGGDIFDSPDIGDSVAGTVGKTYQRFPVRVSIIPGNHDLRGNSMSTLYQTKLGLLGKLGIVNLIKEGDMIKLEKNGITLQITGSPSDFGINLDKEKFILREKECDIAIHMVHAMLLKEDAKFGTYLPLKEIQKITKADITLSGDFHLGFDIVEMEGKYFLNPGAIIRKSNLLEEIDRQPQIVLISIYDDKSIKCEYRQLQCASKGDVVLDRSKIESKILYNSMLDNFKQTIISNNTKTEKVDINDIIKSIAKQDNIDDEVKQCALEKVDVARVNLKIQG